MNNISSFIQAKLYKTIKLNYKLFDEVNILFSNDV